ncbi:MAG: sn-glycerol-3-phosphate ABC transporter permease UgpA [Spirochaetaceae bacterium]|nr:MAG: sn-glycerol-3-phosphate ABC transporter permease UgpA [Spirochaetaceae bacterium]TVR04057.1 MAG: sn-glycerol-3-phosphate ABC transporter permease UgpA [Spirochaetaceae bacterium]
MVGKRVIFKNRRLPYLLISPEVILVLIFFIFPAAQALIQSLFREDAFGITRTFVGLANFRRALSEPLYVRAIGTTIKFAIAVALSTMGVALFLSSLANAIGRKALPYQTIIIAPYAVAPLVAGVMWFFMFSPAVGLFTYLLRFVGIQWNHTIIPAHAFLLVVVAASWQRMSYNFLFYLAGMQSIPDSLVESAAIDGATPMKRFWFITFPLLSPTSFFLLIMNFIYTFFETFPIIHQLTQGGPSNATATMVYRIYRDGFRGLDFGGSAAQSVVLMAFVVTVVALQFRYVERKVVY